MHVQIQVHQPYLGYVCGSSESDAFVVATELIKKGADVNDGCPLHVALKQVISFYHYL
jgi:hypothetical protein